MTADTARSPLELWQHRHQMTDVELAARVGCAHTTIYRIRAGVMLPTLPLADRIVDVMAEESGICYRTDDVFPVDRLLKSRRRGPRVKAKEAA